VSDKKEWTKEECSEMAEDLFTRAGIQFVDDEEAISILQAEVERLHVIENELESIHKGLITQVASCEIECVRLTKRCEEARHVIAVLLHAWKTDNRPPAMTVMSAGVWLEGKC